jgi:hypothetical protein
VKINNLHSQVATDTRCRIALEDFGSGKVVTGLAADPVHAWGEGWRRKVDRRNYRNMPPA